MTTSKKTTLLEGPVTKGILVFTLPLLVSSIIQQGYHTVDMFIVGRAISTSALAAMGAVGPLLHLVNGIPNCLALGSDILISQEFGRKNINEVKSVCISGYLVGFFVSLFVALVGLLYSNQLMALMGVADELVNLGASYLRIVLMGSMFSTGYLITFGALRSLGKSAYALVFSSISFFLNIVLDLIFVIVFGWEIAGAAIATVLSQGVLLLISIIILIRTMRPLLKKEPEEKQKASNYRHHMKRIVALGFPLGIQNMVVSLMNLLIQKGINAFGTNYTAGYSVFVKIDGFIVLPLINMGNALSVFFGQNFGAGNGTRIAEGKKASIKLIWGYYILAVIVVLLGARYWGSGVLEGEAYDVYITLIFTLLPFYIFMGYHQIYFALYRGYGKTMIASIIILINFVGVRLIWLYGLAIPMNSIQLIVLSYACGWIGTVISFKLFMRRKLILAQQEP